MPREDAEAAHLSWHTMLLLRRYEGPYPGMALELAVHGINVNAILPGTIDSGALPDSIKEMTLREVPKGRWAVRRTSPIWPSFGFRGIGLYDRQPVVIDGGISDNLVRTTHGQHCK
jgi:hypothetical protein